MYSAVQIELKIGYSIQSSLFIFFDNNKNALTPKNKFKNVQHFSTSHIFMSYL